MQDLWLNYDERTVHAAVAAMADVAAIATRLTSHDIKELKSYIKALTRALKEATDVHPHDTGR